MIVYAVLRLRPFHGQPSAHLVPHRLSYCDVIEWELRSVVVLFPESPVLQHPGVSTRPLTETARRRCSRFASEPFVMLGVRLPWDTLEASHELPQSQISSVSEVENLCHMFSISDNSGQATGM
jgi:hypothetical protein